MDSWKYEKYNGRLIITLVEGRFIYAGIASFGPDGMTLSPGRAVRTFRTREDGLRDMVEDPSSCEALDLEMSATVFTPHGSFVRNPLCNESKWLEFAKNKGYTDLVEALSKPIDQRLPGNIRGEYDDVHGQLVMLTTESKFVIIGYCSISEDGWLMTQSMTLRSLSSDEQGIASAARIPHQVKAIQVELPIGEEIIPMGTVHSATLCDPHAWAEFIRTKEASRLGPVLALIENELSAANGANAALIESSTQRSAFTVSPASSQALDDGRTTVD